MRGSYKITTVIFVLFIAGVWYLQSASNPSHHGVSPTPLQHVLGANITSAPAVLSTCHEKNGLPDPTCTPGSIDPAVTQATILSTICVNGYTKTVRPPVSYT